MKKIIFAFFVCLSVFFLMEKVYSVDGIDIPIDFDTLTVGTKGNLADNFEEIETKVNNGFDSLELILGRMAGYTGNLTITSEENTVLKLDDDQTGTKKLIVLNGAGDTVFWVSEDSTGKFFGDLSIMGNLSTGGNSGATFNNKVTISDTLQVDSISLFGDDVVIDSDLTVLDEFAVGGVSTFGERLLLNNRNPDAAFIGVNALNDSQYIRQLIIGAQGNSDSDSSGRIVIYDNTMTGTEGWIQLEPSANGKVQFYFTASDKITLGHDSTMSVGVFRIGNDASSGGLTFNSYNTAKFTDSVCVLGSAGFGTETPQAKVHITLGGTNITPSGLANELMIENNGETGMTIASDSSNTGSIYFASQLGDDRGTITYNHATNLLNLGSSNHISFDPIGGVGINDITPSYKLDVNGTGRFVGALSANTGLTVTGGPSNVVDLLASGISDADNYRFNDATGEIGYGGDARISFDSANNRIELTTSRINISPNSYIGTNGGSGGLKFFNQNEARFSDSLYVDNSFTASKIKVSDSLSLYDISGTSIERYALRVNGDSVVCGPVGMAGNGFWVKTQTVDPSDVSIGLMNSSTKYAWLRYRGNGADQLEINSTGGVSILVNSGSSFSFGSAWNIGYQPTLFGSYGTTVSNGGMMKNYSLSAASYDDSSATISYPFSVGHGLNTSTSIGLGVGIDFSLDDTEGTAGNMLRAASIKAVYTDVTNNDEDAKLQITTIGGGSEGLRAEFRNDSARVYTPLRASHFYTAGDIKADDDIFGDSIDARTIKASGAVISGSFSTSGSLDAAEITGTSFNSGNESFGYDEGSGDLDIQGCSAGASSVAYKYSVIGSSVTLQIGAGECTSDSVGFALTGLPNILKPDENTRGVMLYARDNGGTYYAIRGDVFSAGYISLDAPGTVNASGWTSSGTKTLGNVTISYTK